MRLAGLCEEPRKTAVLCKLVFSKACKFLPAVQCKFRTTLNSLLLEIFCCFLVELGLLLPLKALTSKSE